MFNIEIDNIFAIIIFILAMAGIIGLTIYKMYKKNNGITLEAFLDEHYEDIIGTLQDVVTILLVNVEDYPDKESYEKDIIRLTIEKLDDNCKDYDIDIGIMKLINKDALAEGIHTILTNENVTIFTSTVPKNIMEENADLYDEKVLEVADILETVNNEINDDNEETKTSEPDFVQQETSDAIDDILNNDTNEEDNNTDAIEQSGSITEADLKKEDILPSGDTYYTEVKESVDSLSIEDTKSENVEIANDIDKIENYDKLNNTAEDIKEKIEEFKETIIPTFETAEQLANLAKLPNADVDSAVSSIKKILNREHINHD